MPDPAQRLNQLLTEANSPPLDPDLAARFAAYLTLLKKWNARTNLTAIRDDEGILSRHFVESILCARHLPIGIVSLLDYGSGAGFPGIPIALIRNEIAVTLSESQNKKTAFLHEAARVLNLKITVHANRAETLARKFDCVTLRAVDQMERALPAAIELLHPAGTLAVFTTINGFDALKTATIGISWDASQTLKMNDEQILAVGRKSTEAVLELPKPVAI